MSGGLFGWIGDGLAEIASEVIGVFKSDDASGSNPGATQGTTTSRNQERGRASYLQGQDLERYTEQQLDEFGLNALWDKNNLVYDETLEQYGKTTQVDVLIRDGNDNEVAIIECKAYTSKWNDDDAVDQARRLVSLANERGIPLIFSTYDGTTDCFGSRVKEVLNQTQYFVISSDNIFFADPSDVKENGVTQGLPPELRSHWDWWFGQNYEPKSSCRSDYSSNDPNGFDSSYETESSSSPDYERSDSADSGGSWDLFSNWFGDSSEAESSNNSNSSSINSRDSGNSWFSNWFDDSSESESSNASDSSSINSNSRDSSDYGSSDYGSGDYGNSGDSDYGSSHYGSGDYGDSGDSDSGSSSSDSGDSDYGSSDYGSGDYGDSSGSDSSSSSSDSWW
ncbi:hypothetical protein BCD67_02925 [Oscillatoriales cyanobacterium USR001]|nr:hypothetical protein BCD67_02925 [Oscillatoriales cyanobacterium USR001]